jgi:hypothetical protein
MMNFIASQFKTDLPQGQKVKARIDNLLIGDIEVGSHKDLLIPILRYGSGMSRGAYFKENKQKFLGTFYYFDIDSEFFLKANKVLVAKSKYHAHFLLTGIVSDLSSYAPEDYSKGVYTNLCFDENGLTENGEYYHRMYAVEDNIDQDLCLEAKKQNYDCIILLRMFGQNRIVSEVLDVRDRSESFASIYRQE